MTPSSLCMYTFQCRTDNDNDDEYVHSHVPFLKINVLRIACKSILHVYFPLLNIIIIEYKLIIVTVLSECSVDCSTEY